MNRFPARRSFHTNAILHSMLFTAVLLLVTGPCQPTALCQQAGDQWLLRLADSQTLLLGHFNPQRANLTAIGIRLRAQIPAARYPITSWFKEAEQLKQRLKDQQVDQFAVMLRSHANAGFSLLLCIPYADDQSADQIQRLIPTRFQDDYAVGRIGAAWVAATPAALKDLQAAQDQKDEVDLFAQDDFRLAFAQQRPHALRAVVRWSEDHVSALDTLDADAASWLKDRELTDEMKQIRWLSLCLDAGHELSLRLSLRAGEGTTTKGLHDLATGLTSKLCMDLLQTAPDARKSLISKLQFDAPLTASLTLGTASSDTDAAFEQLLPAINRRVVELSKRTAMKRMRDIVLMILNHESAFKSLPPSGGTQKLNVLGKLSWRVHVLPFLGDEWADLYQEFHLGEDWDSEHNKSLIPRMPASFLCPNSNLRAEEGLSNFCVPTGPDTMWPMDRLLVWDDVADAMATTISVLEVRDEFAQIWTKPEPFEVDPQDLAAKLGGHINGEFLMATADGAMEYHSLKMKPEEFASMLTRDGSD